MIDKITLYKKISVIIILISYILFGRTLKYFASTEIFISFAKQINFSINHLSNYISIMFYILQLMLYWFLFKGDIIDKSIYNTNSITNKSKKIIAILIVCLAIFSFLASSYSIPIGTKFNNSIIGAFVSFILLVIFAPIVEELFFRVIIIKQLQTYYRLSFIKMILIQSILFYIPHLVDWNSSLYPLYLGIVSGIFYYCTGSIIYSILLHSITNCASYLITLNIINYRLPFIAPIWYIFFIVIFSFFYYMLYQLVKIVKPNEISVVDKE